MEAKYYSFNYSVVNNQGEVQDVSSFDAKVDERLMNQVVEAMRSNGGFAVELDDIGGFGDAIFDQAILQHYDLDNPDGGNYWDNNRLEIDQVLPEELVADAEKQIGYKSMNFDFYYILDGEEHKGSENCTISNASFEAMVNAVPHIPKGVNAFDFLKTFAPKAYDEIAGLLIVEVAFKFCMREYDKQLPAYLKDFPYQVYEAV